MVEAAAQAMRPNLWDQDDPALRHARSARADVRDDVYTALDAIAPMVWKWLASEVSLGEDWQVEDPRISYVDVQVEKDFYRNVRAAE